MVGAERDAVPDRLLGASVLVPAVTLTSLVAALMTHEARALLKANALGKLLKGGTYKSSNKTVSITRFTTFTIGGVTITVTGIRVVAPVIWLACTARDANGDLPWPTGSLNPDGSVHSYPYEYGLLNPPIRVWARRPVEEKVDGVIVVVDPGETTENIVAAMQQAIYESVVGYARNHGWKG